MIFCSPWFLVFSLAAAAAYLAVRRWYLLRLILLPIASVVFYVHFAGVSGFAVMGALSVFTYFAGLGLHAPGARRPWRLALCLSPAVIALLYFRYFNFLGDTAVQGLTLAGLTPPGALRALLAAGAPAVKPLGISFFAFEFCHYLVDVYKGAEPVRNVVYFSIFALFYPRLASGPIVRFQQIVPQLKALPPATHEDVFWGLSRIATGFAKKFILADPIVGVLPIFNPGNVLVGTDVLWLCLLLYVRIYMDFGGYCDMAIGLARLFGIRLPENFNFPFIASSPSEFWKRWHISLSTWIRDYIYIPLGGGRVSPVRKSLNLLFAMGLCGLWHGSSWNFVLWGVLHGLALQIGHGLGAACGWVDGRLAGCGAPARAWAVASKGLGWVMTQAFVSATWIVFFFPADSAWRMIGKITVWP